MKVLSSTPTEIQHDVRLTDEEVNLMRDLVGKVSTNGITRQSRNNITAFYDALSALTVHKKDIIRTTDSPWLITEFGPQT